jgi:uncharacterized membrane protein
MKRELALAVFLILVILAAGHFSWQGIVATARAGETSACPYKLENFGKAFLEKYCYACHSSSKKGEIDREGAPKGMDYDNPEVIGRTKDKMIELVSAKKKMPKDPPKPTDEERANFQKWLECEYK